MGHPMRLELTLSGLLVKLSNHYTTQGALNFSLNNQKWLMCHQKQIKSKSLSVSSLGYKAYSIVINFLLVWSICRSFLLIYFKNHPEYPTRGTAKTFISLMRYLREGFVSRSFLALSRYTFLIFSFVFTCLMVSAPNIPKFMWCFFIPSLLMLSDFVVLFFMLFPILHCGYGTFFFAKLHSYNLGVHSYCLYHVLQFFFTFFQMPLYHSCT